MPYNEPPAVELRAAVDAIDSLFDEYEIEVCQRDHGLLEIHHPGIFEKMCKLVAHGVELDDIRKRTERIVKSEPVLLQRVVNAATYERKLQVR